MMSDPYAPDHTADDQALPPPVEVIAESPARDSPDPAKAEDCMRQAFVHAVVVIEGIVGLLPMAHGLAARVAMMRAALDSAIYHLSTPTEKPPPSRDPARVAVLERIVDPKAVEKPTLTPAQEAELKALTA
jgi:hypothetical protein